MPLITHRGADGLAEANTLDAIQVGDTFSPIAIEIDVNCTSDMKIIVVHGPISQEQNGHILDVTYEEILQVHPEAPLLKDALALNIKSSFLLDIKTKDPSALELIKKLIDASNKHIYGFTSPHLNALKFMKRQFPKSIIFITQPYHHSFFATVEKAQKNGFGGIMLNRWWLGPFVLLWIRRHNLKVSVYTVDSKKHMRLIHRLSPNINIVTNRPDVYRDLFPTTE